MICPGWRARCCHCVRNIPVSVAFFLWRKVWMRLPPGIVWPKWQSIRWMFSITSGRTICRVGYSFSALLAAAKRGVRVRLLLDDNNTPGLDDILRLLDSHPRIEVRLFNPFSFRLLRPLGYITDFSRLNRRMHNKSFTVDGVVTLVGGEILVMPILGQGKSHFFRI